MERVKLTITMMVICLFFIKPYAKDFRGTIKMFKQKKKKKKGPNHTYIWEVANLV